MVSVEERLLLATGNGGELYTVDPLTEKKAVVYEDEESSQITAMAVTKERTFLGCANPAKLVGLSTAYNAEGTYVSDLIDAEQPARWGKLQIEAEIPDKCAVLLSSRSGNVKDPNDPTFSAWSEPVKVTRAIQLRCPVGRFCQYRLTLRSSDAEQTPKVSEIAVAHVIPNLAPKVKSVKVARNKAKAGVFMVTFVAGDGNKDTLVYKVEFRKVGRDSWIELKDELTKPMFEWDGKTVEDGRYEVV